MECLTLCLLAKERKLSQFTNYNFNSMAMVHGRAIGASAQGLFFLDAGDKDTADNIPCEIRLASTDFGIPNPKKVRRIYLGFRSLGDIKVTVSADDGTEYSRTLKVNKTGQGRGSVTIRSDIRGRYWTISISNTAGSFLALDYVGVLPIVESEGFKTV